MNNHHSNNSKNLLPKSLSKNHLAEKNHKQKKSKSTKNPSKNISKSSSKSQDNYLLYSSECFTKHKFSKERKQEVLQVQHQNMKKDQNCKSSKKKYSLYKDGKYKNNLNDWNKIHSDEESTNVYKAYRSTTQQQCNPPLSAIEKKQPKEDKLKQIKKSPKHFTVSVKEQIKPIKELSYKQLRQTLKSQLQSYKSISKLHSKQSEYYSNILTVKQGKRLEKLQSLQKMELKTKIQNLKEQISRQKGNK